MKYLSSFRKKFDAGHRYTVDIEWSREGAAVADLEAWQRTVFAIESLTYELADRSLEKQLGPHHPSVYGIAAFFMERLSLSHPITRVRVHESGNGIVAIIENDTDY